jgi:hypothetical protein
MKRNPGHCPSEAVGQRVAVQLRNGSIRGRDGELGWPADGKGGCRWAIHGWDQFDIIGFQVVR